MQHGNNTENTSFLDVCLALKNNIFRTMNVADVCVIREINGENIRCEYITNNGASVICAKLQNLTLAVNDVVLVVFTNNDFRASLNAFKSNQLNTNSKSTNLHAKEFGIIVGIVYRR